MNKEKKAIKHAKSATASKVNLKRGAVQVGQKMGVDASTTTKLVKMLIKL